MYLLFNLSMSYSQLKCCYIDNFVKSAMGILYGRVLCISSRDRKTHAWSHDEHLTSLSVSIFSQFQFILDYKTHLKYSLFINDMSKWSCRVMTSVVYEPLEDKWMVRTHNNCLQVEVKLAEKTVA